MSFSRLTTLLSAPGATRQIVGLAEVHRRGLKSEESIASGSIAAQQTWYSGLDRALDVLVKWSGSVWMFCLLTVSVFGWAFAGISLGKNTTWQVFISDYQAILTYFFDSLLMRQQLRDFDHHLGDYATIRSRMSTHARLLEVVQPGTLAAPQTLPPSFPVEPKGLRFLTKAANTVGHLVAVGIFWIGIAIWLGFGHSQGWSNAWQLYCNSGTSALMVLLFAFLALVREQHCQYSKECFDAIKEMDRQVESTLREATDDNAPNPGITITFGSTGPVQRAISYYAVLISMLMGIMILTMVVIIWVSLGPTMEFGNNWWLLIGTYAGLVGMIDGFVLRNTDEQLALAEKTEWAMINNLEDQVLARCNISPGAADEGQEVRTLSTTQRISNTMNRICAHRYTVVAGVMTALTLIIAASSLKWTFTGQLLCNVPPSVIESFFMIILISGHNDRNARKTEWCERVYKRRLAMLQYVVQPVEK